MTKTELIERVAEETGETKAQTQRIIDSTLDAIEQSLSTGEDVTVVGFGSWKVRQQRARAGQNPHTGERMVIPARRAARFTAGTRLRLAVR
jgi:DNA-binding protein HU-beta